MHFRLQFLYTIIKTPHEINITLLPTLLPFYREQINPFVQDSNLGNANANGMFSFSESSGKTLRNHSAYQR